MKNNPIAFNPDTMTVSQVKECTATLRMTFMDIERNKSDADIVQNLRMARDFMLKHWGEQS